MGKRELLIVVGFLVAGAVVYQFTAPPPAEGRSFTLRRLIDEIRSDIRRDSTNATVTVTGTLDVSRAVEEVRLSGINGRVEVHGEDRDDVAYEVRVHSTGPDATLAESYARRSVLIEDDLGKSIWLRMDYPPEGQQRSEITLRLPRRMALRLEGGNAISINALRALRLEAVTGEAVIDDVAELGGTHRNGRLTVTGAGSVSLTLTSSRATFTGVSGPIALRASRGETHISDSTGAVEIEQTSNELRLVGHDGTITISGTGGEVYVEQPQREVRVDVRNTEVSVTLDRAVPVTVLTTNQPIVLRLAGPPPIVLDARITDRGTITADDFQLMPTVDGNQSSIEHAFDGARATRVLLRNRRDDIVIRLGK
ncbi:MAG TPA: DUF4097 family beta strand repeat-containing protein [Vicinamibacterales bacterium]|nr:DUF4097 family beta strand repeat-containing protein [Vicinamibacterales bacterium]